MGEGRGVCLRVCVCVLGVDMYAHTHTLSLSLLHAFVLFHISEAEKQKLLFND